LEAGDYAEARELAERSLGLRLARGLAPARALASLGHLALREGDLERAEELLGQATRGFAEIGDEGNVAWTCEEIGLVALERGDNERATDLFRDALRKAVALGDLNLSADCFQDLAVATRVRGHEALAARLWGAGSALNESAGSVRVRREREMRDLPEALVAEGASLNLEQALELALSSEA
jgi:tetratricopeptide (TPR) repeat protein